MTIGKVRKSVLNLSGYRPGKAASQAEAEHGIENAIKLASNENPYSPPSPVATAIADAIAGVNRYGDHRATTVRAAVAKWIGVDPTQVATGCGSSGLLQQVMFTYVDAGDEVVFPWPSFEIYPVFCNLFDATQVKVDLVDLGFDLDAVAAAVTDRTKVIFLATPNNPTGTCVSTAEIEHLLAEISEDVILVIDEAYREFSDPAYGDPVTDLLPSHPNVLVTRTFSKAYGLAGLRSGYAIGDSDLIEQLDKTQLPFSVNNLAQAGMLAAIEHEGLAKANVAVLNAERARCVAALEDEGWDLGPTHANFIFLPTGERTDGVALELEKQGVVVRPFSGFGIRITISTPEENARWLAAL